MCYPTRWIDPIISFLLKMNEIPAGQAELPPDPVKLDQILTMETGGKAFLVLAPVSYFFGYRRGGGCVVVEAPPPR